MTVRDLHCDKCGTPVPSPLDQSGATAAGVRFVYHPGRMALGDDSGLMCTRCWAGVRQWMGSDPLGSSCAVCRQPVTRYRSLHLRRFDDPNGWRLCEPHAAEFLNLLRTVQPKFDVEQFRLPLRHLVEDSDG